MLGELTALPGLPSWNKGNLLLRCRKGENIGKEGGRGEEGSEWREERKGI